MPTLPMPGVSHFVTLNVLGHLDHRAHFASPHISRTSVRRVAVSPAPAPLPAPAARWPARGRGSRRRPGLTPERGDTPARGAGASCLAGAGGEVGVRRDELPIGAGVGLPGAVTVPPPLVVPRQAAPVRAVVAGEPQQHELPVLVGA